VQFSKNYFESLMKHAVPLNETAISRLAHNAMALDIYTWLAQRLHRVEQGKSALIPWTALYEQFGQGYERIRDFRRVYVRTLKPMHVVYPEAKSRWGPGGNIEECRPPQWCRISLRPRRTQWVVRKTLNRRSMGSVGLWSTRALSGSVLPQERLQGRAGQ